MGVPILNATGQPGEMPGDKFQSASVPNAVSFRIKDAAPPSLLYIQRDDQIGVLVTSSIAAEVVTFTARLLRADDGQITTIQFVVRVPTAYVSVLAFDALSEGYLLSLEATPSAATQNGQTFVLCVISRAGSTFPFPAPGAALVCDYVTNVAPGTWPGGSIRRPTQGPGNPRVITIANPGVGTDWTQTVQVGADWELVSLNAVLTTAAVAGNRQVQLVLDDGATAYFTGPPNANLITTTVNTVSGAQLAGPVSVITTDIMLPIPPRNFMRGGDRIRVLTAGLNAGDQWSAIRLFVREWLAI